MKKEEIDYELGVHDCGQNPYCSRYRSCGVDERPLPSKEKIKKIIEIGTKEYLKLGLKPEEIEQHFKEIYGRDI